MKSQFERHQFILGIGFILIPVEWLLCELVLTYLVASIGRFDHWPAHCIF